MGPLKLWRLWLGERIIELGLHVLGVYVTPKSSGSKGVDSGLSGSREKVTKTSPFLKFGRFQKTDLNNLKPVKIDPNATVGAVTLSDRAKEMIAQGRVEMRSNPIPKPKYLVGSYQERLEREGKGSAK